jgi:hypothetical protein
MRLRNAFASLAAVALLAPTVAFAHVDQAPPPKIKQAQKLKLVNNWQESDIKRTDAGFKWRKIENRFKTIWLKNHPPKQHTHFNPNGVYPGAPTHLINCESGGNPTVVSSNGLYHGLYQFSVSTWQSVGGTGLPSQASPYEQHKRAAILWNGGAGAGHWPVCGSR